MIADPITLVVSFLFSIHWANAKEPELFPYEIECRETKTGPACNAKMIHVEDCKRAELIATKISIKDERVPKGLFPHAICRKGIITFGGLPDQK